MSWRKFGGSNQLEHSNNINTINLATDTITIRNNYIGLFDISGSLKVSGETDISGNLYVQGNSFLYNDLDVYGNLIVNQNTILDGNLTILQDSYIVGNSFIGNNANINQSLFVQNDSSFNGNLSIKNNAFIYQKLFLGETQNLYLYGDPSGFMGVNTTQPQAILDIQGNIPNSLYLHSSLPITYSIPAQNSDEKGLLLGTDGSSSFINFFNDTSMNINLFNGNADIVSQQFDSQIKYTKAMDKTGGILNFTSPNTAFSSRFIVSPDGKHYSHINNESIVIYDISNGYYYPEVYGNIYNKGSALTLVSPIDTSSITFLNIGTIDGVGASIGAGEFPIDPSFNSEIFIIGLNDSATKEIIPSIIGLRNQNVNVKNKYTIGVNTFHPKTNNYIMDINGQIHIGNGQINIVSSPFSGITNMKNSISSPSNIIMTGSPLLDFTITPFIQQQLIGLNLYDYSYNHIVYYSYNCGNTWRYTNLSDISQCNIGYSGTNTGISTALNALYVYDCSLAFIGGDIGYLFYTNDGGATFMHPPITTLISNSNIHSIYYNHNNRLFISLDGINAGLYYQDISYNSFIRGDVSSVSLNYLSNTIYNNCNGFYNSNTSTEYVYFINNSTVSYTSSNSSPTTLHSINSIPNCYYNNISVSNYILVAYGNSIISYSYDVTSQYTWKDISYNLIHNFTGCVIRDPSTIYFTTSSGEIFYTNDAFISQFSGGNFLTIPYEILNAGGNSNLLGSGNYSNILLSDNSTFLISNIIQAYNYDKNLKIGNNGQSNILACHLPYLLNRFQNSVLDICGSVVISGDMKILDGGKIYSNNTNMNLFNESVSNIYFGGDANKIIMGNSISGNTQINNNLVVLKNASLNGNLFINGNSYQNNIFVNTSSYIQTNKIIGYSGDGSILKTLNIGDNVDQTIFSGNVIIIGNTTISGNVTNSSSSSIFPSITATLNSPPSVSSVNGGIILIDNIQTNNIYNKSSILLDNTKTGFIFKGASTSNSVDFNISNINKHGLIMSKVSGVGAFDSSFILSAETNIDCSYTIADTTPSYNYNSGALKVIGGVGVQGNISVGGIINSQYDISVNGNIIVGTQINSLNLLNSTGKSVFKDASFQTWVDISGVSVNGQLNLNRFVNQYIEDNNYNYTNFQFRVGNDVYSLNTKGLGNLYAIGRYVFSNPNNNTNNNSLSCSDNIGLGSHIMGINTFGSNNTGIGFDIMNSKTDGSYNIAIGSNILNNDTIGGFNTAIGGINVLKNNITGSYNTAIGSLSGNNNQTGNYNTYLGYNTSSLNTNYNYSCALGVNSQISGNHQIVLGTSSEIVVIPSLFKQW